MLFCKQAGFEDIMKYFIVILLFLIHFNAFSDKAKEGFNFEQSIGASYNPLGLEFASIFYYTIPLIKSNNILFESTKIETGFDNRFTPADERFLIFFKIEPIAFFDIKIRFGLMQTYDLFNFGFARVENYSSEYDSKALSNITQENKTGYWGDCSFRLKLMIGNIIFINSFFINYVNFGSTNKYFYERHQDVILKYTDYTINNDTILIYKFNENYLSGINFFNMYVPDSEYLQRTLSLLFIYKNNISKKVKFYGIVKAGTHLSQKYYKYSLYTAFLSGIEKEF